MVGAGSHREPEQGALEHDVATIGWNEIPDISKTNNKDELKELLISCCNVIFTAIYINTYAINIDSLSNQRWFKKQLDRDAFYSSIEEIFAAFGSPYGAADNKIIPNGFFWSSLGINVVLRSREYSDEPTQDQCSSKEEEITRYGYLHTETEMLMLGLMVLSWLKVNLTKKTENGHCHNSIHGTTEINKPAGCPIGSNFHRELYNDYTSILEEFVDNLKAGTPTQISSSSQK